MEILDKFFGPPNIEKLEKEGDVSSLVKALHYEGERMEAVQASAAQALGRLGGPRAIEALVGVLTDKDRNVAHTRMGTDRCLIAAEDALAGLGSLAVEPLVAAYKSGNIMDMEGFVSILAQIDDQQARDLLVEIMQEENDHTSIKAAFELARLKDSRVLEPMIARLEEQDAGGAASALGELGDSRAAGPLVALLKRTATDINWDSLHRADEALVKLGEGAVEALLSVIKHDGVGERAADILGKISDPRAIEPLAAVALTHMKREHRLYSAQALGKWGELGITPLVAALDHEDSEVRSQGAIALGWAGVRDRHATEHLVLALKDKSEDVRKNAVFALGELGLHGSIGDVDVESALITALEDNSWIVRVAAAHALGKLKSPQAVGPLAHALFDERVKVREATAEALNKIGGLEAERALTEYRKLNSNQSGQIV